MTPEKLRALLDAVAAGEVDAARAAEELASLPFRDLGFARLDTHRPLRTGHAEVVFGHGKTSEQVVEIVEGLLGHGHPVLVTRADAGMRERLAGRFEDLRSDADAGAVVVGELPEPEGLVAVLCAGTSDVPVAAEAALTAEVMGSRVERFWDVGVAGLQRVLAVREEIDEARCLVVAAGMEGALPSVVGGLVRVPVIAVPTSVGYGASFGGVTALLSMLNSCAPGVAAVNIDNGFGAGYLAHLINQGAVRSPEGAARR